MIEEIFNKLPDYIGRSELAKMLGTSSDVVSNAEASARGPKLAKAIKVEGRYFYRGVDVVLWLAARLAAGLPLSPALPKDHLQMVALSDGEERRLGPRQREVLAIARDLTVTVPDAEKRIRGFGGGSEATRNRMELFHEERARVASSELDQLRQLVPVDFQLQALRWWASQNP